MKRLCLTVLFLLACGDDDVATDAATPSPDVPVLPAEDAGALDAGADVPVLPAEDAGPDAGPRDTWTSFAMEFMDSYCVECHEGGTRDYRTIDDVRRDMVGVRCGVTDVALDDCTGFPPPRQFPVGDGPKPSDEDRARLVRWVEADLPVE